MKVYVIQELGFEYDDNHYFEIGGGEPVVGYRNRNKALKEMERLNNEKIASGTRYSERGPITQFYELCEIELED